MPKGGRACVQLDCNSSFGAVVMLSGFSMNRLPRRILPAVDQQAFQMMTSDSSAIVNDRPAQTMSSGADRELLLLANRLKKTLWRALEIELEREKLSVPQWLILSGLARKEGGTLTHFSRLLDYDAGSLSRVIHQLRLRGLIMTDRASPDRRNALLQLSETGLALHKAIESRAGRLLPLLAATLGNRRIALLAGLVERAIAVLEEESVSLEQHPSSRA